MSVSWPNFNAQWVCYSPSDYVFCLHRDSGSPRGERLTISRVFPGHAYCFAQEYSLLDPQEYVWAFQNILWTSYFPYFPFQFLARFLFGCDIKKSLMIFFFTNYLRDRALSHQVFWVRSNNNRTLNGLFQRQWDKLHSDNVLKVEPCVELSIPSACCSNDWRAAIFPAALAVRLLDFQATAELGKEW